MVTTQFDSLIHEPKRLQICAFIQPMKEVEFKVLREHLGLSESALSKHVKSLEEAGYIKIDKRVSNSRNRTWISFTNKGRRAFNLHVKALKNLINDISYVGS